MVIFQFANCKRLPGRVPSGYVKIAIEAMAIEIVDLHTKNGDVQQLC